MNIVTGIQRNDSHTYLEALEGPDYERDAGTFQWDPPTEAEGMGKPIVYAFMDNKAPNILNSGAPELTTKLRTSFEPDPEWLDDTNWYDLEGWASDTWESSAIEVKDGLRLRSTQK
jgi:hypothetical protein